ncbi:MAG TPA: hypothetical protein DIW50_13135 [Prolixibacteraceae bacterium]|nr:hypothetical protein [Prolixibacteraceae bacterium]
MKRYIIPVFAVFLLAFSACEDVIDVKISEENLNLYAVEAKITTESNPFVFLYRSMKVDEDMAYPGVSGATVLISENGQPQKSIQLKESPENKGLYLVPENEKFFGEIGKKYTITIEHDGITITGSDQLSKVEPVDSIQVRPSLRGDKRFLGIFTNGKEPEGVGNFYKWDIFINGKLLNGAEYLFFASDELVDGNYVKDLEIFTDFHDPNEPEEKLLKLGYSVLVKQNSISEFAYRYYYQMYDQHVSGSLFSLPSANIRSNFTASDGKPVFGLFTAHDVSASNVLTIDQTMIDQLKD